MHEWLSGGVSPCQGEGRGFESRLVLFDFCSDCAGFRDLEARILFISFNLPEVFTLSFKFACLNIYCDILRLSLAVTYPLINSAWI